MKLIFLALFFVFTLSSCSNNEEISSPEDKEIIDISKPNILLVIADDMGLDATPNYDVGSIKPNMHCGMKPSIFMGFGFHCRFTSEIPIRIQNIN